MIKKLNRNRFERKRPLPKFYFEKNTTDYMKIFYQLSDIRIELKELRDRIWIHALRLRNAIKNTESFQIKTELRFQEKIVLQHINEVEKLQKENEEAQIKNYEKQHSDDLNSF